MLVRWPTATASCATPQPSRGSHPPTISPRNWCRHLRLPLLVTIEAAVRDVSGDSHRLCGLRRSAIAASSDSEERRQRSNAQGRFGLLRSGSWHPGLQQRLLGDNLLLAHALAEAASATQRLLDRHGAYGDHQRGDDVDPTEVTGAVRRCGCQRGCRRVGRRRISGCYRKDKDVGEDLLVGHRCGLGSGDAGWRRLREPDAWSVA
mmetsp:Transcript_129274/g.322223  ORF Transcript_129274/g.322223 Transcript_129274/m.322223 type:complete len:205 (-) Transcript_129274:3-617(-)